MLTREKIGLRLAQFAFVVCVAEWAVHGAAWGMLQGSHLDKSQTYFHHIVQTSEIAWLAGWFGLLLSRAAMYLDRGLSLARRAALASLATIFLLGLMHTV